MYVSKLFRFEASHILPRHPGKCSRLHGHSWRLEVGVWGPVAEDTQFVLDYADLKKMVQPLVDLFDHRHLNCFIKYPSSENVATYVAHELVQLRESNNPFIVRVSETEGTWAEWRSTDRRDAFRVIDKEAEWRSPDMPSSNLTVPARIEILEKQAHVEFVDWQDTQTELEQLRLYVASMNLNPELPKVKTEG